mmetsp:Transcript_15069/g.42527  ORF Transcript_15069/g.42527 Transcript_15069/m.42527 type:complete len:121 (-) Transcript_15069:789-1151(-)
MRLPRGCCWRNRRWVPVSPTDARGSTRVNSVHSERVTMTITVTMDCMQKEPIGTTIKDGTYDANGIRPLTVGEISVNWSDGGMVRNTVRTRFHIAYENPIPILQEIIEDILAIDDTDDGE